MLGWMGARVLWLEGGAVKASATSLHCSAAIWSELCELLADRAHDVFAILSLTLEGVA